MTFLTARRVSGLSARRSGGRHLSARCPNTFLHIRHISILYFRDQYARANMKKCWDGLKSVSLITDGCRIIQVVTTIVRISKKYSHLQQNNLFCNMAKGSIKTRKEILMTDKKKLTTNAGAPVADNQNVMTAGP